MLKGTKHSSESIKKMKIVHSVENLSDETRRKYRNRKRIVTNETRKKLSAIHKGRKCSPRSEETKRKLSEINKCLGIKPPSRKGSKITEEHKKIISESNRGEKCSFWRGGIAKKKYPYGWSETLRRSIRERDNYTCKVCNEQQSDIAFHVHHIDYNKNNCNPNNLITLCINCHAVTNFDREKWQKLFGLINEYGRT
jgi:5-methylcytosine-specific restriction endonuclease McrA